MDYTTVVQIDPYKEIFCHLWILGLPLLVCYLVIYFGLVVMWRIFRYILVLDDSTAVQSVPAPEGDARLQAEAEYESWFLELPVLQDVAADSDLCSTAVHSPDLQEVCR